MRLWWICGCFQLKIEQKFPIGVPDLDINQALGDGADEVLLGYAPELDNVHEFDFALGLNTAIFDGSTGEITMLEGYEPMDLVNETHTLESRHC